ncbi:MAG TPA: MFS transporter [Planctomycetota bacterium]
MRLWRYCVAAFIYDWFVFVFWTAVPVRAVREFGASSTQLALLQAASTVPYVLNSLFIGTLADRWSKSLLARVGCVVAALACVWTAQAPSLAMLFVGVPLLGIGASIFWPPVQGGIGAETDPARMERALGTFNVMWSLGKAAGFAMAGKLVADMGHSWVLWISAASAVAVIPLYPRDVPASTAPLPEGGHEGRAAFRTMSYVANFAAFGVGATLQNQFFKYLKATVSTTTMSLETYFGLFLGAVFLAQTLMFFVLQRGARWTYRRWLLYGAQLLAAAALSVSVLLRDPTLLLLVAPLVGVGIGFTYASSIYYSLHGPSDHGRFAGIHEAVLGAGSFIIPLAGGVLADLAGDLRAPYWLAAGVSVASLALQERIYRRSP